MVSFAFAQPSGSISQGLGITTTYNLMPACASNHITPSGTITSSDNKVWNVPAPNNFSSGPYLTDLHNQCNNITPSNLASVNLNDVPVNVVDVGGDTITAFLFCDNYFELYINGTLIGVDAVPFTPFNSSIAKFKVSRPYTIAVKLVDWEENLGLGSEIQGTDSFHVGDGGFIAQFSDGTVTGADWKTQSFYIAPLQSINDIMELPNGVHSTTSASTTPTCKSNCYGVHYDIPVDWASINFNDSAWPNALVYNASQVTNQPAYTNFANTAWSSASFIWSSNLFLDNLVLTRKTVGLFSETKDIADKKSFYVQNPFGESIFVSAIADYGNAKITLYDLSGKIIKRWDEVNLNGRNAIQLDLIESISTGVYLLEIKNQSSFLNYKIIHKE